MMKKFKKFPIRINSQRSLPVLILFLLGMIWGTGYSIAKYALMNGVSPLGYSFWQSLGPAIILSLSTISSQQSVKISAKQLRYFVICGLVGITLPNTNIYFTVQHLPAGLLAVIVNTVPIITYPLALGLGQERFSIIRMLGVICAVIGLMLIVVPKSSLPDPTMIPWVLLALFTPFCFALCAIYITQQGSTAPPLLISAAGMLLVSTLLLTPWVLISGAFYPLNFPFTLPKLIILLEIILSSIGYVLFFKLLKIAGAVYYSLVDGVVALTGLIWGLLLFHETLNQWTLLAVILIVLAILIVSLYPNLKKRTIIDINS